MRHLTHPRRHNLAARLRTQNTLVCQAINILCTRLEALGSDPQFQPTPEAPGAAQHGLCYKAQLELALDALLQSEDIYIRSQEYARKNQEARPCA